MKKSINRKAFLLALTSFSGVGPKTLLKILNVCQKKGLRNSEFLANKDHIWQEMLLSEKTIDSIRRFKREHNLLDNLLSLEASGVQILTFEEKAYPQLLLATEDFPPVLFVKSQLKVGSKDWQNVFAQTISIVGTRRMTAYGQLVIRELVPPLVSAGRVVVSGFMYGVDLAAAQMALKNGGQTIAVLGFGFDHCFPSSQKKIMQEFLERGAIFLSEFIPETLAKASNFVTRNRIVAGLSKATLVIEAAERSGSHITASYANDYGRIVMAVPGPITNPFSEGTKVLISQGATLVNNASDILKEISDDYHFQFYDSVKSEQKDTDESKALLEKLTFYPELAFEDLMKNSNFAESELNQLLFDLELQGKIIKKWGKYCLVS
ncbi:DNA-processing protein DprA [Patescibacteria group bacterium]|nr:DNA-processing protein DprA [Patescibacteria group bacterium]